MNPHSAIRNSQSVFRIPHSGLTLIELLIVTIILTTLVAAAIPVLTPTTAERRIRESSRGLNSFISAEQAAAIGSKRPRGVAFKRLSSETGRPQDRGVCLEVFAVEQPVPYAGFSEDSACRIAINGPSTPHVTGYGLGTVLIEFVARAPVLDQVTNDELPPGWDADLFPPGLIRPGDILESQGNRYLLLATTSGSNRPQALDANGYYLETHNRVRSRPTMIVAQPLNNTGQLIVPVSDNQGRQVDPVTGAALMSGWIQRTRQQVTDNSPTPPYWTEPAEYKILRQPVTTSSPPYQLPEGVAVDLEASGIMGQVPFHVAGLTDNDQPIYILFTPEGAVERVQLVRNNGVIRTRPTESIALLIGRRENIPAPDLPANLDSMTEEARETEKNKVNWLNMGSRWVTIGAQSGTVVTTENAFVSPSTIPALDYSRDGVINALDTRMGQIIAAQEFAREMRRMGGR